MHRHKWIKRTVNEGRLPEGSKRLCETCGALQVKRQGRWQPTQPTPKR
jgi:hypothetical protein